MDLLLHDSVRLRSAQVGSGRARRIKQQSLYVLYKKMRHGRVLKWFLTPWRNL